MTMSICLCFALGSYTGAHAFDFEFNLEKNASGYSDTKIKLK